MFALGGRLVMQGYDGDKAKILARLRRVEGQVHAVAQMVEDDVYCICLLYTSDAADEL